MNVLYLTEGDVAELLDMKLALEVTLEAFTQLAGGRAMNVPRQRAQAPGIILHTMSAAAAYLGVVGWKCYTTTAQGARFHVALYDQTSGEMLAWVEADRLGRLRTGATTGVAAQWMAGLEASEVGLFGTGKQAETQLEAMCAVRSIRRSWVYSRDADRRASFAARMSKRLGIEITPADRPQEAVEDLPIVVTATTSREPVFDGRWLSEGTMVAAVGSNALNRAEIDAAVIRRADAIVCDSVDGCRAEAGDFVDALERGIFHWSRAVELANVVTGHATGHYQHQPQSISLFKSVGLAIEDVALAAKAVELARTRGIGRRLSVQ